MAVGRIVAILPSVLVNGKWQDRSCLTFPSDKSLGHTP